MALTEVEIRPIEPDDSDALAEGYLRLSEESRYRRFLAPRGQLTSAELRYLTEVDHHDHEGLVAIDPATGQGVGVARYVRSDDDPTAAEMAIAVADDWQGAGVGTRLMTALADRARQEGIARFTALLLADNDAMIRLLREVGEPHVLRRESGTLELGVELPPRGIGRLSQVLRTIARSGAVVHVARALSPR